MFLRRLLLLSLVLLCAFLAFGCATDGYDWKQSSRGSLPVEWWAAGYDAVQTYCYHDPGYISRACAIYSSVCLIVAEREEAETPKWLAEHERRHCLGWDHEAQTNVTWR
jgi:hypothetical protein